ncbi:hypothetical protein FD754_005996 [Muntiacus muntjak]|uniref:RING-type E3 ubiquitin transferase n=1 Tax=Muntiacus muntjak TaxID=9888 RepID=A0A5N3WJ93_MUNMU|nr:hypothetical protein FD754_005996 [Muntiacus muntjak]
MGFSKQKYWSGLSFPYPGDLPNPRMKSKSPIWQADSLELKTKTSIYFSCLYFMHGLCKEGDNCHYSHGLSDSPYGEVCNNRYRSNCKVSPAASMSFSSAGPIAEMNMGEADVPGQPYCGRTALSSTEGPLQGSVTQEEAAEEQSVVETKQQLCPYAAVGERRYGENCTCLHGDSCDTCGLQVLHPLDAAQRSEHIKSCIEAHEDMELSFAVQRSKDMVCSNCMEVVYEKANPREHRFRILSNCCLKCIRKWRSAKQRESKIIKSCPECLIMSNFVIPSEYWVEEREEKQKRIQKYKEAMSCGSWPFGENCFYKHAYPDGCREEPQNRKHQRRSTLLTKKVVTVELGKMLLMLLAAGGDDDLTDAEDEWDLFHDELEDFYDLDL